MLWPREIAFNTRRSSAYRSLARFRALSASDRLLLGRAAVVVALVRVCLCFIPLKRLHRLTMRLPAAAAPLSIADARRRSWAVSVAGGGIPGANCLSKALALQLLLQGSFHSRLHVGFVKRDDRPVEGHAWLEWHDGVLIGGGELANFATVLILEDDRGRYPVVDSESAACAARRVGRAGRAGGEEG